MSKPFGLRSLTWVVVLVTVMVAVRVQAATPAFTETKLLASDGAQGDFFGSAVAISGDTALIGAAFDDDKGFNSGAAYVFVRDPTTSTWTQQARLVASDGAARDNFGTAVAISGDTAVIGAPDFMGAAYVFVRDPTTGTWSEKQTLLASDRALNDLFGFAVGISGDAAVIGALDRAAYVFVRDPTGTWSERAKLVASDRALNDLFGIAVTISGGTALIGAAFGDGDVTDSGTAYAFTAAAALTVDLLDPVPDLLEELTQTPEQAKVNLAQHAATVRGVAADGVARVVVRVRVSDPGTVELTLVDAAGIPLAPAEEAGLLTQLGGAMGSNSLFVPTVEVPEEGSMAFAVYQAPSDFVRAGSGDANARGRDISLRVRFTPQTGGAPQEAMTPITIARPPVVLVHGLWGFRGSWNRFFPLLSAPIFTVFLADYESSNAHGLDFNRPIVAAQLKRAVAEFKTAEQVAAVQADVVAHSMGGLVVRMLPLLEQAFFRDDNFQLGDVHKLINIGTPHFGSPLARFLRRSPCVSDFLTDNGRPTNQGAIEDLVPNSQALNQINGTSSPLELHQIVGLAGEQNKRDSENSTVLFLLGRIICRHDFRRIPSGTFFDTVLQTPEHDLIVPASSQRGGAITNVTPVPDVIHRQIALFLFGIEELESREISGRVIELLNTPTSEPDFASFQPVP